MNRNIRRQAWRRGRLAEGLCVWFLRAKGYQILARGYRTPVGEIDIVARRGGVVAFIEVKARSNMAKAAESLMQRQRHRIVRAAGAFLKNRPDVVKLDMRFDVVLVSPWQWPAHVKDAFGADGR